MVVPIRVPERRAFALHHYRGQIPIVFGRNPPDQVGVDGASIIPGNLLSYPA